MSIRNYIKKNRRQSSIAYSTICSGATSLNTPQLAAGSFILKWLMDENVFLDKPSEIIPGKTVKGWMVDQVLQDYMQGLGDFEGRHEFSESI